MRDLRKAMTPHDHLMMLLALLIAAAHLALFGRSAMVRAGTNLRVSFIRVQTSDKSRTRLDKRCSALEVTLFVLHREFPRKCLGSLRDFWAAHRQTARILKDT